jgi:hypothetical protein
VVGSFYGTGADLNVRTVGFRPKAVHVFNVGGLARGEWVEGMADDSAIKTITDGTISLVTANGITPLSDGFAFGADTDLNVSGELCRFVAHE